MGTVTAKPKSRAVVRKYHAKNLRGKDVFTAGEVAKVCRAAVRTVSQWIDSGQIVGYRLPGRDSDTRVSDRRVTRTELVRFLRAHGMPLGSLSREGATVVLVSFSPKDADKLTLALNGYRVHRVGSLFAAGMILGSQDVNVCVIDLAASRSEAVAMAQSVRAHAWLGGVALVAVANEDEPDAAGLRKAGFAEVIQRPFDEAELVKCIQRM